MNSNNERSTLLLTTKADSFERSTVSAVSTQAEGSKRLTALEIETVLAVENLVLGFDGNIILNGISCKFTAGGLTSIVGPNGAGKTSFFNLLSGHLQPQSGKVFLNSRDITRSSISTRVKMGIGRSFQINKLFPDLTVFENIYLSVSSRLNQGHVFWRLSGSYTKTVQITNDCLSQVGLYEFSNIKVSELSHGEQRKLEFALLLALDVKVWLLDEPTAGLGVDELPDILGLIAKAKADGDKLILLIEHKLEAVKQLSDRILVLNQGKIIADGSPAVVMSDQTVQQAYFGGLD